MPENPAWIVQAIDAVVFGAGALAALGVAVVWLGRERRWRNPLSGVAPPLRGPLPIDVFIALAAYVGVTFLAAQALPGGAAAPSAAPPGSHAWHLLMLPDAIGKIAGAAVCAALLAQRPIFARSRLRPLRAAGIGLLTALVAMPIVYGQAIVVERAWKWIDPSAQPPLHATLIALRDSEWGAWGTVQLCVAAGVLAPLAEELFFRGLLLGALWSTTGRAWLSILLSAAIFGAVHFAVPQSVLPLMTMGVVFGFVRLRTRSLAACVIAHAAFNGYTLAKALLFPEVLDPGGA